MNLLLYNCISDSRGLFVPFFLLAALFGSSTATYANSTSIEYLEKPSDPLEIPYSSSLQSRLQNLVNEADMAIQSREWEQASRALEEIVLMNAGTAPVFLALGHVYQQMGYHEQALAIAEALSGKSNMTNDIARLRLSALNDLGRYDEAASVGLAHRIDLPDDAVIRLHEMIARGNVRKDNQVLKEFADTFQEQAIKSGSLTDLLKAAVLFTGSGQLDEAENLFYRAMNQYPGYASPLNGMAILESGRGHHAKAIEYLLKAANVEPDNADTWSNLATLYLLTGEDSKVDAMLLKALSLKPDHPSALEFAVARDVQRDEPAQAMARCDAALKSNRHSAIAHYLTARLYMRQNMTDKAEGHLLSAIVEQPGLPGPNFMIGMLEEAKGHEAVALRHYERESAINPDHVPALNNRAWIHCTTTNASLRDPAKAVDLAKRACALTHYKRIMELHTLIEALIANNDFVAAIDFANQAAGLAAEQGQPEEAGRYRKLVSSIDVNRSGFRQGEDNEEKEGSFEDKHPAAR